MVVNPFVSYEILGNEKGSLQLLAGARYLWIEVGLDLETRPPLPSKKTDWSKMVMCGMVLLVSGVSIT